MLSDRVYILFFISSVFVYQTVTANHTKEPSYGGYQMTSDLKHENFTKLLTIMKYRPESIKEIQSLHDLAFTIAPASGPNKYLYTLKGLGTSVSKEIESGKPFPDKMLDGRSRHTTITISGRMASSKQQYDPGTTFMSQHIVIFFPWGADVVLTASSVDGKEFSSYHMYFKRI